MSKKHKNTRHCVVCKKCVMNHDHHCMWINSCIGKNNYWNFIAFLIIFAVDILFDISVELYDAIFYHDELKAAFINFNSNDIEYVILSAGIVINFIVFFIMAPISFKQFVNLKNFIKRKRRSAMDRSKSKQLLLKDIYQTEHDSTSDTASMLVRESLESNSELTPSSSTPSLPYNPNY